MFETLDFLPPEEAFDGPMQMALDEVLLKSLLRPLLRIYRWESRCITFGYSQRFDEVRSLHPDLPLVRRRTGGGIVRHGDDLTFSLMVPRGFEAAGYPPSLFYHTLHALLARELARISGALIRLAAKEEVLPGPSCFAAPACDDVMLQGRKILGGAQHRSAGALLYQGSIQGAELFLSGETPGAKSASEVVSPEGLASALSSSVFRFHLGSETKQSALEIAGCRYGCEAWNRRR